MQIPLRTLSLYLNSKTSTYRTDEKQCELSNPFHSPQPDGEACRGLLDWPLPTAGTFHGHEKELEDIKR